MTLTPNCYRNIVWETIARAMGRVNQTPGVDSGVKEGVKTILRTVREDVLRGFDDGERTSGRDD